MIRPSGSGIIGPVKLKSCHALNNHFPRRSFGMELAKKFREEIHSVAIHPDGLYVAAGFIDKIRFLNLLIDDMRLFQV